MRGIEGVFAAGINYKTAERAVREEFGQERAKKIVETLYRQGVIESYAVNLTCLRFEIYFTADNAAAVSLLLASFERYREHFFVLCGYEAVRYLFEVSAGLDSLLVGEDQILQQIKRCHAEALAQKSCSSRLNKILNIAIATGKRFRNESAIRTYSTSLESLTVKLVERLFGGNSATVFLVGVSEMNRGIMRILLNKGFSRIMITNRSAHKTAEFTVSGRVKTVPFQERYAGVRSADVVISATSAPHILFACEEIRTIMQDERKRVLIDLAVPRDIAQGVEKISGVSLYLLEDIIKMKEDNLVMRREFAARYGYLIDEALQEIQRWERFKKKAGIYG